MANIPINTLTLEDVIRDDDSFETQRAAASGGASRRNTRLQILTAGQKWKGMYDVREAGIIGDGSDEAAKLNTAYTTAYNENRFLWVPPKFTIGVSSKVTAKAPTVGGSMHIGVQYRQAAMIINTGINNIYTPMLEIDTVALPDTMVLFALQGITLDGRNYATGLKCSGINVVAGRETPGNFSSAIRCLTHYILDNFQVNNCYGFGIRLVGFIGVVRNFRSYYNGTNRLILANSVIVEGGELAPAPYVGALSGINGWGLQLLASDGKSTVQAEKAHVVQLSSVCIEGNGITNGLSISEGMANVTINSLYLEGMAGDATTITYGFDAGSQGKSEDPNSSTYALIAATGTQYDAVFGLTLINCGLGGGGAYSDLGARVRFNNLQGLEFVGKNALGSSRLEFTGKCVNVKGLPSGFSVQSDSMYARDAWIVDSSNSLGRRAKNLVVNANGRGGARGWKDVIDANGHITLSELTGNVPRNGISCLKVLHSGAAVSNYETEYVRLVPYGNDQRNLTSRYVAGSCWLFVPTTASPDYASRKLGPAIGFYYEKDTSNGSNVWVSSVDSRYSMQYSYQDNALAWQDILFGTRGLWHLIRWWVRMPALPIRNLAIAVWPVMNTQHPANPANSNYINIADLVVCIDPSSIDEMSEGKWVTDELSGLVLPGGAIEVPDDAPPDSTTAQWSVGDRVRNIAPASAGTIGWVCTAAGAPGTWKSYGTIS